MQEGGKKESGVPPGLIRMLHYGSVTAESSSCSLDKIFAWPGGTGNISTIGSEIKLTYKPC